MECRPPVTADPEAALPRFRVVEAVSASDMIPESSSGRNGTAVV
jgi:hypothetical protein